MKKNLCFLGRNVPATELVRLRIFQNSRRGASPIARRSRLLAAVASLGAVTGLFGTHSANAAGSNETWTGATDNSWASTGNWSGTHATPVTGDILFFNSNSTNLDLNNNLTTSAFNIAGINYASGSGAYVIGDGTTNPNTGNTFILGANIVNASGVLQTIDDPFSIVAVRTISPEAGGILLTGNISGTNGGISEAVSGVLTLAGSNSYTGGTTVANSTLTLTNVNAVSASVLAISGGTVNLFSNSNATFNSAGVALPGSATINVDNNGSGSNNTLSLGAVSDTASITQTLTVTGGDGYGLALGALSQTAAAQTTETIVNSVPLSIASFSTISTAAPKLSFQGAGTATVMGAILQNGTGALALDRSGTAGTLILQGTSNMTGATTISNGTIQTAVTNAFGSTTGISIGAAGTLQLLGDSNETFGNGSTAYPILLTASGATIDVDQVSSGSGAVLALGAVTMNGTYTLNTTGTTGVSLSLGAVSNNATSGSTPIVFNNTISAPGGLSIASIAYPNTTRPGTPGQLITFTGNGSTTVSGPISENSAASTDTVGVTVGGGTLNLNGTSTYLGPTTASGGTLNLNGSITGSNVSVASGGTFSESSTGAIAGTATTLTMNASGLTSTLAGSNSYTGSTVVTAGTLVGASPYAFGAGIGSISATGTLKVIGDSSGSFSNGTTAYPVSFTSGATIDVDQFSHAAAGTTLTLGAVTSSGTTNVLNTTGTTGVSLSLGDVSNSATTGSGSITFNNTIAAPGGLTVASVSYPSSTRTGSIGQLVTFGGTGSTTVTGSINQNPASATYTVAIAVSGGTLNLNGTSTYAGTTTVGGGTLNLNGSITGTSVSVTGGTFSQSTGAVIGGTNTTTFILNASGTTSTLAGSNSYAGLTTVTAGNLQIANSGGSALGSGTVALSGGTIATLSGTGFNSGKVTVTGNSQIAPGTNGTTPSAAPNSNFGSAGVLTLGTTGGLALTSATLDFDLAASASGSSDEISTTALTLTSVSTVFNGLGSSVQVGTPYILIHYSGTATGNGAAAFSNANTTFVGALAGMNYSAAYSLDTGNDNVDVTFSATPEPGSIGLLVLGGLTLMRRRRVPIETPAERGHLS